MTADLGQPPPKRLERPYRTILEANDLFMDTCGATLSVNPATDNMRLQRFDLYDVLMEVGPFKVLTPFAEGHHAVGCVLDWHEIRNHREDLLSAHKASNYPLGKQM